MTQFKWFFGLVVVIAFIIGFLFGSSLEQYRQQKSQGAQKINCSIAPNFGPNGEFILIEDIVIEKKCFNSKNPTTFCVLGIFETEELAKFDGQLRNCRF